MRRKTKKILKGICFLFVALATAYIVAIITMRICFMIDPVASQAAFVAVAGPATLVTIVSLVVAFVGWIKEDIEGDYDSLDSTK